MFCHQRGITIFVSRSMTTWWEMPGVLFTYVSIKGTVFHLMTLDQQSGLIS